MAASEFVIAGRVDCERYARLEAAADYFQSRLPSFRVHKEPHTALEWPCFLRRTCAAQGWPLPVDADSPLVWRLLVQRGGRGLLVGGVSEFLRLAALYYGLTPPELSPAAARPMAAHTADQLELERRQRRQARAVLQRRLTVVAVLGSPLSGAARHFLTALAAGSVLGESVLLRLQLLGEPKLPELAALQCELQDLASPYLVQVAVLSSVREAVRDASVVVVLDPVPNVLPPEPPEPPPPLAPPEEPPPPADRAPPTGRTDDTEQDIQSEPAAPAAPPARDAAPQVTLASSDERLPGDLAPPPRSGRGASARRSGEPRKLSVIVEDPDSEEKEEEEMEQIRATQGGSGRSTGPGYRSPAGTASQQQRNSKSAADPATGKDNGAESMESADSGAEPGQTDTGPTRITSSADRALTNASLERAPNTDGWLKPPLEDGDSDVAHDELEELFSRMQAYAAAIDATATKRCRVVVAGGRMPCLAATVLLLYLPRLPRTNVIAVCQPRVNQLRALLAERLGVAPHNIHGLVEWGNPPAGRSWLDLDAATVSGHQGAVRGPPGYQRPLLEVFHQRGWLQEELPRLLAERSGRRERPAGAEVSALPLAVGLADTLRRWWRASDDGRLDSLGVASEGEFGVPAQLVLAAPVRLIAGDFRVCRTLPLYGDGAAAVRATVDQMVGWLWRFGVRLSASGRHCTLSACPSSTITGSGSGERLLSDAEQTSQSDGKTGDGRPGGAEGDGGSPPEPRQSDEGLSESQGSTGSGRRPSDGTGPAASSPRPGSAHGERTPIPAGDERLASAEGEMAASQGERNSSTNGEKNIPVAGDQSLGAAGSTTASPPTTEDDHPPSATGGASSSGEPPVTAVEGSSSGEQRRRSEMPRDSSLTAEGERGYIPVQQDQ